MKSPWYFGKEKGAILHMQYYSLDNVELKACIQNKVKDLCLAIKEGS